MTNKTTQNFSIIAIALLSFVPNSAAPYEGASQATEAFEQSPMGFLIRELSEIANTSFSFIDSIYKY